MRNISFNRKVKTLDGVGRAGDGWVTLRQIARALKESPSSYLLDCLAECHRQGWVDVRQQSTVKGRLPRFEFLLISDNPPFDSGDENV